MTKGEKIALEVFPIDASRNTKLVRYHFGKGYDKGYKDAKYDFIKYITEWLNQKMPLFIDSEQEAELLINSIKNYLICK